MQMSQGQDRSSSSSRVQVWCWSMFGLISIGFDSALSCPTPAVKEGPGPATPAPGLTLTALRPIASECSS